ncbi:HAD family hydrolase [Desulfosoma caldarium]|uniref:FMN phosphatase YigB (HAD superfamily) n=1 Tax=Desulfosoma caldarium TaxID=610254 RepID=A0A3N1UVT5_9BACT|nr:HAD family hydrolase [Desulfosoma caldarium]ROQ92021.1 FMN phosphatase YigB (HAD superfamily) [Desulfosoma caldarium]
MPQAAFFFDIGQTLVTGAPASPRRLLGAALHLNEDQTKAVGKLMMTLNAENPETISEAMAQLLPSIERTTLAREVRRVWHDQIACVRQIPEATPLIRRLKEAGHCVGLISNIWHPFFLGFQKACGEIDALVDFRFLSYRAGVKKPSESLYQQALGAARRHGLDRCWMIGDSYELDIAPARRVGMHSLWILCRPERERPVLAEILNGNIPAPDGCVPELKDVLGFLKERGWL